MTGIGGLAENVAAFVPFQTKLVQDVLAHPEMKALAARFPGQAERLRDCIEGLSSQGPAETEILVQATRKAFDAITGKLSVFLSYKRAQHGRSRSCSESPWKGSAAVRSTSFWTR